MVITDLSAGTTYTCILMSENPIGGYASPVPPIVEYRSDEAVFQAVYQEASTLPTYPDPVTGLSCTAIVDPLTHPALSDAGVDGAPSTSAPALWYQPT